jgi:hypothetical protein
MPVATMLPNESHVTRMESSDFDIAKLLRFLYSTPTMASHRTMIAMLSGKAKMANGMSPTVLCKRSAIATIMATVTLSITDVLLTLHNILYKYLHQR